MTDPSQAAADWKTISDLLTPAEYEAYRLHVSGMGYRSIALHLGIHPSSVRDRIRNAKRKLATANEGGEAA